MSSGVLLLLFIFLLFLLLGSIFITVYLVYDIRSGNYRKLLSAQDEHQPRKNRVQKAGGEN